MSFVVWNAGNELERQEWMNAWLESPEREVFAHPAYAQLYERERESAVCAAWRDGDNSVLFPLLIRRLPGFATDERVDLTTPYGYGGPYAWGGADAREVTDRFWRGYLHWTRELAVVSEFVRFSLFPESQLAGYPGETVCRAPNIVRTVGEPEAWLRDCEYKVRKNLKHARSAGVRIAEDPSGEMLDDFLRIYSSTMRRRGASAIYQFPEAFFRRIQAEMPGSFTYFHALLDGRVISTELVLLSARRAYSFLGGTDQAYFPQRPNDLLKYAIVEYCAATGRRAFVLGGGYEPDDGIFRYKQSFAPRGIVAFHVGRRIADPVAYETLVAARGGDPDWHPRPDFFPAYRA